MSSVLDASAILAFLRGEPGADLVERHLSEGARCSAVNWSEVAQKVPAAGREWDPAKALLVSYELQVDAVTQADGEWAARRWRRGEGLSIADRLCLALSSRLGLPVVTADRSWSGDDVIQIR